VTFADRADAGRRLAALLSDLSDQDVVVLGMPRGGVVVAAEVARALDAPLDVILVRKLGVPVQPELAMGAVGENGVRIVAGDVVRRAGVTADQMANVEQRARAELVRQAGLFRKERPPLSLVGRTALVVDDGVATGSSAGAACRAAQAMGAARVVLAVPVGSPEAVASLSSIADEVRCLYSPAWLGAIGQFYRDFAQTSDKQVIELLESARPPDPNDRQGSPLPAGARLRSRAKDVP
jgi:putative phosphoribosyl transferase